MENHARSCKGHDALDFFPISGLIAADSALVAIALVFVWALLRTDKCVFDHFAAFRAETFFVAVSLQGGVVIFAVNASHRPKRCSVFFK